MACVVKCPYNAPAEGKVTYSCNLPNYMMCSIENFVVGILRDDYKINFADDGILVHWTLGVFIDYFAEIKGDVYTDKLIMERVLMASISVVAKFCHDETWQSQLSIVFNAVDSKSRKHHTLKQLINVEMDIITTMPLIPCFRKYCPEGYALIGLEFVKVDEPLTLESLHIDCGVEKKNGESA